MNFAGRNWYYSYRELFSIGTEKKFNKASNGIASRYTLLTKSWNEDLNSQWTSRTYLSTKMILNATVLLKQREFAQESNLRVVVPYLEYYAVLSLLRGVVFMFPDKDWEDGKLIEISHAKAISLTCDWIAKFDQEKAKEVKSFCNQLKAQRELISYKAPASGDANLGFDYDIEHFATLLAEVAQFNSELLESSVKKNTSKDDHVLLNKHAEQVCNIEIEGFDVKYFSELKEQTNNLVSNIDFELQELESKINLIFSIQGHRLNEVMKTLTILSVIFIPLTFLAGIYGMNFENIPELKIKNGYFILLGVMVLVTLISVWYFKRKKWF